VSHLPPIGSLFAAFLGFNPIQTSRCRTGVLVTHRRRRGRTITGRSFFPKLIAPAFAHGLHLAFDFAAGATFVAVAASALRGGRYVHQTAPLREELAEGAAESAAATGVNEGSRLGVVVR
jgi:hypothetical protein